MQIDYQVSLYRPERSGIIMTLSNISMHTFQALLKDHARPPDNPAQVRLKEK